MVVAFVVLMVVLFGVSVFVHELGHFLVAKALGMEATVLPSTSPANAQWSLERLIEAWSVILREL